jgi:conjugal transfer/entry exclusion protein
MKTKIYLSVIILMTCVMSSKAQFVTFDPSNLAQSIVNTTKQVIETSTTASNMVNNFKESRMPKRYSKPS